MHDFKQGFKVGNKEKEERRKKGRKILLADRMRNVSVLGPLSIVSFASIASNMLASVERPSQATNVPATVAALRMFNGASSFNAVFNDAGQCSDSIKACSVRVAPSSRLLPFLDSESKPRACKSTAWIEAVVGLERSVPPPRGRVFG